MNPESVRGKTIQWTFTDGPMANHSFEHVFKYDGSLTFRPIGGSSDSKPTSVPKYEVATLGADIYAASYLGPSGYTLTAVLDYRTGRMVAFASNAKELSVHHGTFRDLDGSQTGARAGN